jgi:hypothetical protein
MALRLLCLLVAAALAAPAAVAAQTEAYPVVLELFTSQGCSSCPAADQWLNRVSRTTDKGLGGLIPLAYHVDYWNALGWADPFASGAWTRRQHAYSVALRTGAPYTPQLVINGRWECVGSDEQALRARLQVAQRQPPAARIALQVFPDPKRRMLLVHTTTRFQQLTEQAGFEVWVAVHESGLTTTVRGGENSGRVLANDFVVRHLVRVQAVRTELDIPQDGAVEIAIPADWQWPQLGVAAWVQHATTQAIEGAAQMKIGDRH